MNKLLIGGAVLLASAAAIAQVAPVPAPQAKAARSTRAPRSRRRSPSISQARYKPGRRGHQGRSRRGYARVPRPFRRARERAPGRSPQHAFERHRQRTVTERSAAPSGMRARAARAAHRLARSRRRRPTAIGRGFRHAGMGSFGGHMFEMADANKDGRVTLQEAQAAALKSLRHGRRQSRRTDHSGRAPADA